MSVGPILIFGLARSGTSWLGKLFDSHPETAYRHEPDMHPRLAALPRFPLPEEASRYAGIITEFMAELPRMRHARVTAKIPLFPKAYRCGLRHRLHAASATAAKLSLRAHLKLPIYGARIDRVSPCPVLVWKSVESEGSFGLLMQVIPEAQGIYILRHPCGQIASLLRMKHRGGTNPPGELFRVYAEMVESGPAKRHGLTLDALRRLSREERLAWVWAITNEKAVEEMEGRGNTRLIRYEDLCADPAGMTRNLFEFAGLNWNRQTAEFVHASSHTVRPGYFSVYKNSHERAQGWHDLLGKKSVDRILGVLRQSRLGTLYEDDIAQLRPANDESRAVTGLPS